MSNRRLKQPVQFEPSDELIAEWRSKLVEYYGNMPGFTEDPIEKATSIIEAAKSGWRNCPDSFEGRILMKSKMRGKARSGLVPRGVRQREKGAEEKSIEQQYEETHGKTERKIIDDHIGLSSILKILPVADKKFFKQRWTFYNTEFDINSSSDYALLMEVVVDELEQKRIVEARLKCDATDHDTLSTLSKTASECLVRLEKSLKALGVTREQRKDEMEEDAESVATLSLQLDKKKKKKAARQRMEKEEEQDMQLVKFNRNDTYPVEGIERPLHNRIPDMKEIVKITQEAKIHGSEEA
jgi:hypothetical protein